MTTTSHAPHPELSPAATALKRKYLEERDKRLRKDGDTQFIEAKGEFADFAFNPNAAKPTARAPVSKDVDVLVIGGGFGGMLTGAELTKAGVASFCILDVAGGFGGTWYWNRYPGIRCDIESYLYLPLLEEVGTVPAERYATGREILEHTDRFAKHFKLYDHAMFETKVESVIWNEDSARWHVKTNARLPKSSCQGFRGLETSRARFFTHRVGTTTTLAAILTAE
jgi:cyclohexanone monooxygenase